MPIKKGKFYLRTKQDMLHKLSEQVSFIESSNNLFDKGHLHEAIRLAQSARVLLHDTNNSKSTSVFHQLDIKRLLKFVNSASRDPDGNLLPYIGLCGIRTGSTVSFYSPLDDRPFPFSRESFQNWWNAIILDDREGNLFSRKDVVLWLANKDGGAHVDENIDQKYYDLISGKIIGWEKHDSNGDGFIDNVHFFTMRQISHELLKSIEKIRDQF